MRFPFVVLVVLALGVSQGGLPMLADEPPAEEALRAAIAKALPLIERGSAGSADERKCFTCHNQALPILALTEARRAGFTVDVENLDRQIKHTADHLKRGQENYLKGKGQGGRVITAGYALWGLEAGERQSDEVTSAVTHFLLEYQSDADHWGHPGQRPPTSGSDFTTTYVALRGLQTFGTDEQQMKADARIAEVREWLLKTEPADTEDRVFRLRSLGTVDADEAVVAAAAEELITQQRHDGGWAQTAEMDSDAYATATVLTALLDGGHLTRESAQTRTAIRYLLD